MEDKQTEISKLQLSEKEEEYIGQCWDGVQDSGKLSMDGLGTLCETLGITMDVIDVAMTDLGSDDLTVDIDDFMLLMGRMLRSGALTLPQAGDDGTLAAQEGEEEDKEAADPNEMSKIQLTESEEDYIGQCWDGVKQGDRLDMEGLHALCETLGIDTEVINMAATGLGAADCTMDRGDFMLLMGRMLRSGALKLPEEPDMDEEDSEDKPATKGVGSSWMAAMVQAEDAGAAAKAKAKQEAGNAAWMASMVGNEEAEEDGGEESRAAPSAKPKAQSGGMAWMATMASGDDVDDPDPAPAKNGMAWMASMAGENVDEAEEPQASTAKAGATAWMASMTLDEGEDVDVPEPKAAAKNAGSAAWMASMMDPGEASPAQAKKLANASSGMAWMASMAVPDEDEDN